MTKEEQARIERLTAEMALIAVSGTDEERDALITAMSHIDVVLLKGRSEPWKRANRPKA